MWLQGARDSHNLTIDYIGIWNERPSDATYVITLRDAMNKAGFRGTKIVAKDGGADICSDLAKNKAYADAVNIIGLHYPSDFANYEACRALNKTIWASEESSSYDDANGAACWARVINSHWVLQQMTSSIMWNLVGSYYHGTNWYSESLMTAVQPWSGYYWVSPVIWATAHVTQFTKVGWLYLKNGAGSGQLPQGGYYVTWVDPDSSDFTLVIVKISHEHAPCIRPHLPSFSVAAENVTFHLDSSLGNASSLNVWYSNFEDGPPYTTFEEMSPITPDKGLFSVHVPIGGYFTITTIKTGKKGQYTPPISQPQFPLPHEDNFDNYTDSSEARYFADQIGIFEIHPGTLDQNSHEMIMKQVVPMMPIAWQGWSDKGPLTVIGMREWQDVTVNISFYIPIETPPLAQLCLATRSDQFWVNAIVLCVRGAKWTLQTTGPNLRAGEAVDRQMGGSSSLISNGSLEYDAQDPPSWHSISLTTSSNKASGSFDLEPIFTNIVITTKDLDNGFAGFGMDGWYAVEFDGFSVSQAGDNWTPKAAPCVCGKPGDVLKSRNCTSNGLTTQDQRFELLATYQLRHIDSGLCATSSSNAEGAAVMLQACSRNDTNQTFLYNYSNVRNSRQAFTQGSLTLAGNIATGEVTLQRTVTKDYWTAWVYFPNTFQLRNQYTRDPVLGYPRCLSLCPLNQ